ncbi:MAG: helix-turn-helix transcriptional regulator [Alphaproteobacteria bacterium]|nr:helix-turn-helix transcriptional regulator [Alphaproteobacteria bacterium]MCB9797727.1 helix-turn-helix transcriptional regulator [Alphaproteobacteria bacterium]
MPLSKDLVAASATPVVLSILRRGDSYGYAILQQVREASGGELDWAEGMLYPLLHRLEERGLVAAYWGRSETGRRRKYYRIRKAGLAALDEQRRRWADIHHLLEALNGSPYVPTG